MKNNTVWVVMFQWIGLESDDYGVEAICNTKKRAEEIIVERSLEYPKYCFNILGEFPILFEKKIKC